MRQIQHLIIIFACIITLHANAQTSCDKLFASGVKCQQTMTVASQNKAISYFEKAKVCYDSQSKKDLCDQQITACRNIISQLSRKDKQPDQNTSVPKEPTNELNTKHETIADEPERTDVTLSIDCTYLKFKGKGGEFKKAKVNCNYPDWEIIEKPDWVNCSKNKDELVVEAERNTDKEERSGSVIINCGNKSVTLTIIQDKFKKFGVI